MQNPQKYCQSRRNLFKLKHSVKRILAMYCKENNLEKELPVPECTTLIFIHLLATVQKLKAGTINSCLAGIRQFHIANGIPDPGTIIKTVNKILKGVLNKETRMALANNQQV